MSRIIYKHELLLSDKQTIELPIEADILDIQLQDGKLQLWAMINDMKTHDMKDRIIVCIGTGYPIKQQNYLAHIATIQMAQYVWHFFEQFE